MKKTLLCLLLFTSNLFAGEMREVTQPFTGEKYNVSVVSEQEAQEFFDYVAGRSYIPFHIFFDGCFERAYQMITVGARKDLEFGKVVIDVLNKEKDYLKVSSPDGQYYVRWKYHVAPYLFVRLDSGVVQQMVLDPSLFDKLVTVAEFKDRLTSENPGAATETVIIPKWVGDKDSLLSEVNLQATDRNLQKMMSIVYARYQRAGSFHELEPYYDEFEGKCYQGGPEVECPAELLPNNN